MLVQCKGRKELTASLITPMIDMMRLLSFRLRRRILQDMRQYLHSKVHPQMFNLYTVLVILLHVTAEVLICITTMLIMLCVHLHLSMGIYVYRKWMCQLAKLQ